LPERDSLFGGCFLGTRPQAGFRRRAGRCRDARFCDGRDGAQVQRRVYQRLLEHGQVDVAVNEARSALLTAGRPDAAVPVLFMRLKSGQLWSEEADARGQVLGAKRSPRIFGPG
jgi:hypothetical protein